MEQAFWMEHHVLQVALLGNGAAQLIGHVRRALLLALPVRPVQLPVLHVMEQLSWMELFV